MADEILKERRVVVLGKTGNGKSSTINTIVGRTACVASASTNSVTKKCQFVEETVLEKRLVLVDTPGVFDNKISNKETMKEIAKIISATSPGFHAFIVVIRIGRFTEEDTRAVRILAKTFGPDFYKRGFVLFTGVDNLKADGTTFEKYLRDDISQDLKMFLHECGDRVVVFNNRDRDDKGQIESLMTMIDRIIIGNGNTYYQHEVFEKTKHVMEEEETRRMEENKSLSLAEVRREIRQDIEKENPLGNKITEILIDVVVLPIVEKLAQTLADAVTQGIENSCTPS